MIARELGIVPPPANSARCHLPGLPSVTSHCAWSRTGCCCKTKQRLGSERSGLPRESYCLGLLSRPDRPGWLLKPSRHRPYYLPSFEQAAKEPRHFAMVEIGAGVISALASQPDAGSRGQLKAHGKPSPAAINVGEKVSVAIWQANAGQILGSSQATGENSLGQASGPVIIPDQIVGGDGAISVPCAGRVRTVRRTPHQVERATEHSSAEQVIKPQAIVTVTKAAGSNSVTVSGDRSAVRGSLSPWAAIACWP